MIDNNINLIHENNMEEINKLRHELEQMYLNEKLSCAFISDKTIKHSQKLDIHIVEEQRRRFNEYKLNKQKKSC